MFRIRQLGVLALLGAGALALPAPAAAVPVDQAGHTLTVAGIICTITPSFQVDTGSKKLTAKTDTTCGTLTMSTMTAFSELEDCAPPTQDIAIDPLAGEATVTTTAKCKTSASGKTAIDASSQFAAGPASATAKSSASGTAKAGETAAVTSTTKTKLTVATTQARQAQAGLESDTSSSFAAGNGPPVTAAHFLSAEGGF